MSKKYSKLGALVASLACLSGMGGNFVTNASTLYDADFEYSVSRTYRRRKHSGMDVSGMANSMSLGLDLIQLMANPNVPGWIKGLVCLPGGYAVVEMFSYSASGKLFLTPKVVRALGGTWEEDEDGNKVLVSEKYKIKIHGQIDNDNNFYPKN